MTDIVGLALEDLILNAQLHHPYYIRVTNVDLFNLIVAEAEKHDIAEEFGATRQQGYYELRTSNSNLWHELVLYGQMLAQLQAEFIETGEDRHLE